MLTRAELAAIRAVLEVRLGWEHRLTQRVHDEWQTAQPEPDSPEGEVTV